MEKPSSYEDCLRAIGYEIDQRKFRAFALEEDSEAIWVLMLCRTGRKRHKRWHYRKDTLKDLLDEARQRRGGGPAEPAATHYQDVLRVVGHELDAMSCQSLLLMEFNGEIMVRYAMAPSARRPHLLAFSEADLAALVQEAMARRSSPAHLDATMRLEPSDPRPGSLN